MIREIQKNLLVYVFLFGAFLFCGCSHEQTSSDSSSSESLDSLSLEGMVRIYSSNNLAVLGTDDPTASSKERPSMKVLFDYDYFIGKHEVTCGEYQEIFPNKIVEGCDVKDLPVTNVTYYDAVLFANAKSIGENMDSAYSYVAAKFNGNGNCILLEGLSFHPEVNGYRLPTEAEWIYAASNGWSPKNGWNAENSEYRIHEVCSSPVNGNGLCDMAGNALEWVDDWLGFFKDTLLTNYLGTPDGGSLKERVVKGGSFRKNADGINLYSRGDVYAVTSATLLNYVGFRLAWGAIPNPVWMAQDGSTLNSKISVLASTSTLRKNVGSVGAKMVFRNDVTGKLCYVNFSGNNLSTNCFGDSIDVYHPALSPDGKYVAFSTGMEGVSGKSSLYVQELKADARPIKLDVESAAIPRWYVEGGDTLIVYVTDGGNNKDFAAWKKEGTYQVAFRNGAFEKPKKILEGTFNGGVRLDGKLAVTGARLLRAYSGGVDSLWFEGAQACNVSLYSSGVDDRVLFLDFGSQVGQDYVGENYGVHERILILDGKGNFVKSIPAPENYSFDHTEWVNDSLVVATLVNYNGAHSKIVLVNVNDSRVVDLVEGDELWHPDMQISSLQLDLKNIDADSAAVYYGGTDSRLISHKMNAFWILKDSIEVVGLGSSRVSSGFKPAAISVGFAFNMAHIPSDMYSISYLANHYVLPQCPKLKTIVVSLDFDLWYEGDDHTVLLNFDTSPGYAYDKNHDFWSEGVSDVFIELNRNRVDEDSYLQLLGLNSKGWINLDGFTWSKSQYTENILEGDSTWSVVNKKAILGNMELLRSLILTAGEQGVNVVGVIFPQSPLYGETGSFGRYGVRRSDAEEIVQKLMEWTEEYSNFYVMDENKMGNHDYTDEMAYDCDHLGRLGAEQLTSRIDSLLEKIR